MDRLNKEDYRKANRCLKEYNYNCINIINIQQDILSLSIAPTDGLPRAPFSVGNTVLNKVINLEENKDLQKHIKEYKAVQQALILINDKITYEIFEEEYQKRRK